MNKSKTVRSKWLTIRLSEEEEKVLYRLYKQSTSKSISEYGRGLLLRHPVTVLYRNQSTDNFLEEIIQLKKELNAIGNNFNQAVHKLHTLDHIPEIRAWAILHESIMKSFSKKADEIKEKMSQIYEEWLQK